MVLCEISVANNFFVTWATMTLLGLSFILLSSGTIFYYFYQHCTFEKWQYKTNPSFPTPEKVKDEIIQTIKGAWTASLAPAFALWLYRQGHTKAFCGWGGYSLGYHVLSLVITTLASDFLEFFYHRCGHLYPSFWKHHRHHHVFFNPSPFAVIADEHVDQFMRALPLLLFPMVMPVNMDLLFFEYSVFFYSYGVYLHWGFEVDYPDAHHPIMNTAFQHYLHHAKSVLGKPLHTGFFIKLWDQLFGSVYEGECFCSKCARAKGERSRAAWDNFKKPDYSELLSLTFWLQPHATTSSKYA